MRSGQVDWHYDNLGRLTREVYDSSDDTLDFTADYLFDLVGNRLQKHTDETSDASALEDYRNGDAMAVADVDEAITYEYDLNDRLLTEKNDAPGTANDRFTVYGYDVTQQTSETVHAGLDDTGTTVEQTTYSFNLQGRMSKVEIDSDGNGDLEQRIEYEYDDSGIRVAKTELEGMNQDGDFDDAEDTSERTDYHIDKHNHTGYAQVLEEDAGRCGRQVLHDRPRRLPGGNRRQPGPPPSQGRPRLHPSTCRRNR